MKFIKQQSIFFASLALATVLAGCSKDDNVLETPVDPPTEPTLNMVPLTQFEVLLGNQTTSGTANSRSYMEEFNHPKTAFLASDYFTFTYNSDTQSSLKAYAYTSDGKKWTAHEQDDANSPLKTIQLNAKMPVLTADFITKAALEAKADNDGIVTETEQGSGVIVGCFDVLRATAEVTISNNKATAKIPFKHVNHLLNVHIKGAINENSVDYLELNVTYKNAAGTEQIALLRTSSRGDYADANGKIHTVLQAIVPRNAVVKGIKAITNDDKIITAQEQVNIDCPTGKSHFVTLNIVNDNSLSLQVSNLIDDWAFAGEMNPDGSPVGNIYINTADDLRNFSSAVNTDPNKPAAKIKGVLAYTAHVVQTANIDLSSLDFRPIGGDTYEDSEKNIEFAYFAGTYDGNGFQISGMKITRSTASTHKLGSYAGMFGQVQSPATGYAVLTNIKLVNVNIDISNSINYINAGALVANSNASDGKKPIIISQCSAQGTINTINNGGEIAAGGLIGEATRTHITGSYSDVSVNTNSTIYSYTGGIVGRMHSSSIASSYAKKPVTGNSSNGTSLAGGIAGSLQSANEYSNILACCSEGDVTSNGKEAEAGGIVAYKDGFTIGCYAKGNASATGEMTKSGAIVASGVSQTALCYGVGAVGQGTSELTAQNYKIVYNTLPAAGEILSIVSGNAWKDNSGSEMAEATVGGILTTIPITIGGKLNQEVHSRLWVLSDKNVWTSASPASNIYPLPMTSYKGQFIN